MPQIVRAQRRAVASDQDHRAVTAQALQKAVVHPLAEIAAALHAEFDFEMPSALFEKQMICGAMQFD
jgi:hypothetical protein